MSSFARVEWGMQRQEFRSLTLLEWNALVDRHKNRQERRTEHFEFMVAQLTATMVNFCGRFKLDDWLGPDDFMPSRGFGKEPMTDDLEAVMDRAVRYQAGQPKE